MKFNVYTASPNQIEKGLKNLEQIKITPTHLMIMVYDHKSSFDQETTKMAPILPLWLYWFIWLHPNGSNTTNTENKPQRVRRTLVMRTNHKMKDMHDHKNDDDNNKWLVTFHPHMMKQIERWWRSVKVWLIRKSKWQFPKKVPVSEEGSQDDDA